MSRPTSWRDLELVCPRCRTALATSGDESAEPSLACTECDHTYPVVLDIPDLRTRPDPYIGFEEDRDKGRTLWEVCSHLPFEDALPVYYRMTSVVTDDQARAFVGAVLAASDRARGTLTEVDAIYGGAGGAVLDLGCGTAPLAIEATRQGAAVVGVDLAFRWLVMAKIRLATAGVELPLVCACAEALPFKDQAFSRVIGESVIEHFEDQALALSETARVLAPGGDVFLTTPNRFSVGPDPHVGIPAGGYLPDSWIAAFIRRRGGVPPRRRLLSAGGLRALLSNAGFEKIAIQAPPLSDARVSGLSGLVRVGANLYQRALTIGVLSPMIRTIGPLLSAGATKPSRVGTSP